MGAVLSGIPAGGRAGPTEGPGQESVRGTGYSGKGARKKAAGELAAA